jgi:hypothetical protein
LIVDAFVAQDSQWKWTLYYCSQSFECWYTHTDFFRWQLAGYASSLLDCRCLRCARFSVKLDLYTTTVKALSADTHTQIFLENTIRISNDNLLDMQALYLIVDAFVVQDSQWNWTYIGLDY